MDIQQHNIRTLYVEAAIYGLVTGVPMAFLSVYALRLGAPNQAIGLLTALPSLVSALWLVPSARLIEREPKVRRLLVVTFLLQGSQYIGIALVPFAPTVCQTWLLLTVVALGAIPSGMYTVVINAALADVATPQQRGRLLGNRQVLTSLADGFVVFAGGWFLSLFPLPTNFQLLFLIVFVLALVNIAVLRLLTVTRRVPTTETPARPVLSLSQVRQLINDPGEAGVFVRFIAAAFVLLFSGWLPRPLFSIYWVRHVNASDAWIGTLTMTSNLVATVGFLLWGRAVHRLGSRLLLLFGSLGYVAYPILTAFAPTPEFLLIPVISGAITFPPYTLGLMNGVLEVAPAGRRATYLAVYTAVASFASFAAPVLCTGVILPLTGIRVALLVGSAARFLGFLAVFFLIQKRDV